MESPLPLDASGTPTVPAWSAVFAITLTVAGLITAEFLPVSLLTPMASDLGVTEGVAGQAITATAVAAIISSLSITRAVRSMDRRLVVLAFSALLAISSLAVAFAHSFAMLAAGRFLLGIALGGFWALSASLAMRLVPAADVPKALSIVFSGVSVALVVAPPFGSFFGQMIGWRGVFLIAAAFGAACCIWQLAVLPSMPPRKAAVDDPGKGVWQVLRRRGVPMAMLAIFFSFGGHFALFTYMRPFYEQVSHYSTNAFSAVLLLFGVSNFMGTALSNRALTRSIKASLVFGPLVMAAAASGLALLGTIPFAAAAFAALWGLAFGLVPVGWSTWITRNLADDAENAGGLQVAVIQLASAAGAGLGGYAFEILGAKGPVIGASILLVLGGFAVASSIGPPPHAQPAEASS